jgi:hypothetical protein
MSSTSLPTSTVSKSEAGWTERARPCCCGGTLLVLGGAAGGALLAVGAFVVMLSFTSQPTNVDAARLAVAATPATEVVDRTEAVPAAREARSAVADALLDPPVAAFIPAPVAAVEVSQTGAASTKAAPVAVATSRPREPHFGAYDAVDAGIPLAASPTSESPAQESTRAALGANSPLDVSFAAPPRHRPGEQELRESLRNFATEIEPSTNELNAVSRASRDPQQMRVLASTDPLLRGLPLRMGDDCKLEGPVASTLGDLAAKFRRTQPLLEKALNVNAFDTDVDMAEAVRQRVTSELLTNVGWTSREAVPAIEQMFQVQNETLRQTMIELLAEIRTPEASAALARRALYDLSPEVRLAAALSLRARPREEYSATLLAGFRYPWEQVAWNATDALVAAGDVAAAPELVKLLNEPDPCAPYFNELGNWAVREVASINHLRNCQLCHAPSTSSRDVVRGMIPTPGQPLPQVYYQSTQGNFVRADVTYLKQDFSVIQPVVKHHPWPKQQRFDYVVRERELTLLEQPVPKSGPAIAPATPNYPQREAVLYALRVLRGRDVGDSAAAWDREVNGTRVSLAR